jgi:hypothetical protein
MTEYSVIKADGIKLDETEGVRDTHGGVRPRTPFIDRPKRKRAFHRALKRGELWAVYEDGWIIMLDTLYKESIRQDFISTQAALEYLSFSVKSDAK